MDGLILMVTDTLYVPNDSLSDVAAKADSGFSAWGVVLPHLVLVVVALIPAVYSFYQNITYRKEKRKGYYNKERIKAFVHLSTELNNLRYTLFSLLQVQVFTEKIKRHIITKKNDELKEKIDRLEEELKIKQAVYKFLKDRLDINNQPVIEKSHEFNASDHVPPVSNIEEELQVENIFPLYYNKIGKVNECVSAFPISVYAIHTKLPLVILNVFDKTAKLQIELGIPDKEFLTNEDFDLINKIMKLIEIADKSINDEIKKI